MTLVPALARSAAHVTMLQRSPDLYRLAAREEPGGGVAACGPAGEGRRDAAKWFHALLTQGFYRVCRRWPKQMRRLLIEGIKRQLPEGYDVATHFTPTYDPWDQRFCAVPERRPVRGDPRRSASVVTDHIARFTEKGVLLESGDRARGRRRS